MRNNNTAEKIVLSITYIRILFLIPLYFLLASKLVWKNELSALVIVLIVLFDIFDGRLADKLGADTFRRRISDSIADKITIHLALPVILLASGASLLWYPPS